MPRPTTSPEFAESAAVSDVSQPLPAILSTGWPFGLKPPHEWVNWLQRLTGQWLAWLGGGGLGNPYQDPATAYADMADGDFARVWDATAPSSGGTSYGSITIGADLIDCDGDGVYVYMLTSTTGRRRTRLSPHTVSGVYTPTNAGTRVAIAGNGRIVVIAYGNYVEAFEPTGASRWVYNHGALVADVCLYHDKVYAVGSADGSGHELVCIDQTAGTKTWGYDHGNTLVAVCAAAKRVFIAGAISIHATGATLRAVVAADGKDAANEGGNGADGNGLAWDQVQTSAQTARHTLATDGQHLYCGYPSSAAAELDVRGVGDGEVVFDRVLSYSVSSVCVDPVGVLVTTNNVSDGYLWSLDRQTLSTQWKTAVASAIPYLAAWSDGYDVFVATATGTAASELRWMARGNGAPTIWHRPDWTVTDHDSPWRGLINPFGR